MNVVATTSSQDQERKQELEAGFGVQREKRDKCNDRKRIESEGGGPMRKAIENTKDWREEEPLEENGSKDNRVSSDAGFMEDSHDDEKASTRVDRRRAIDQWFPRKVERQIE